MSKATASVAFERITSGGALKVLYLFQLYLYQRKTVYCPDLYCGIVIVVLFIIELLGEKRKKSE